MRLLLFALLAASCTGKHEFVGSQSQEKVNQASPEEIMRPEAPDEKETRPLFLMWDGLYSGTRKWLQPVGKVAECIIRNEDFLREVASIEKYSYTKNSPGQVSLDMRKDTQAVLSVYRSKFRWSKVNAYRNVGSNIVYFNTRRNPQPMTWMAPLAIHEWLHVLGYDHASASDYESVPYKVESIATKYVERCEKKHD